MIKPSEIQSSKSITCKRSIFDTLVRKACHIMFWFFGGFAVWTPIYQIMAFQIILSLGICSLPKFTWVNRICPNKFSPLFSLRALPLGWADCSALTPLRDKGGHTATPTHSPGRAGTSAACLPFLSSIFCWGCKTSSIAASSFSLFLPHSICPRPSNKVIKWGEQRLLSSFLPTYHFCPYSTAPSYLHFFILSSHNNKAREGNKSILQYILVDLSHCGLVIKISLSILNRVLCWQSSTRLQEMHLGPAVPFYQVFFFFSKLTCSLTGTFILVKTQAWKSPNSIKKKLSVKPIVYMSNVKMLGLDCTLTKQNHKSLRTCDTSTNTYTLLMTAILCKGAEASHAGTVEDIPPNSPL